MCQSGNGVAAYLDIRDIIAKLKENNVRFIWPGWGLWSEDDRAHREFRKNGIFVLGPEPSVVAALGNKTLARQIAITAGAPVVPGSGVIDTLDDARREAERIGYPVMVKAVSGGGGKGMRVVRSESELASGFDSASKEALASFKDGRVFIEKLVEGDIRHVEVQLVGDLHGNVRHFGTRECSVQRRNQKVIERAPAGDQFNNLADSAVKLFKEVGYSGAGTAEFIIDSEGNAYFMEVNTRLQVEHPTTELIHNNLDLVEAQIRIARGETLDTIFQSVTPNHGVSIQLRVIGESLKKIGGEYNTFPVPGPFSRVTYPSGFATRVQTNSRNPGVSDLFDSNHSLILVYGKTLSEAVSRARLAAMSAYFGGSDRSNLSLIDAVLAHPDFINQRIHINWLKAVMATPEFQIQVHDPRNPINFQDQIDRMASYVAEVTVNGPIISGIVQSVAPSLSPAKPVPSFPVTPTWPLYGEVYTSAGGGVAGSVAVVSAWRRDALDGNRMLLTNTRFRDHSQTAIANRDQLREQLMSAPFLDRLPFMAQEVGGGANTHVNLRFNKIDPIEATRRLKQALPGSITAGLFREKMGVAYGDSPLESGAVDETYRIMAHDGGIQKLRVFQGMNSIVDLKSAVLSAAKTDAIVDICVAFHPTYTPEFYIRFLSEMVEFARDNKFEDRIILTVKDAQGLMGLEHVDQFSGVVEGIQRLTGHQPLLGVHSHNARRTTALVILELAKRGFRHCCVTSSDMLAVSNAQPTVSEVVQVFRNTPWDTQFPLQHLDLLAEHDQSIHQFWKPFMPDNEVSPNQVKEYGIPPGMINNVRQQFLAVGGRPDEFRRFLTLFGRVLNHVTRTTGVTPYSKDAGEIALWILNNDRTGAITTVDDIVEFMVANVATAPVSTKMLFLGHKGTPQFGFEPRVASAFNALPPSALPPMIRPTIDYKERIDRVHRDLELNYSRSIPRYLAVLADSFPGDVEGLLKFEAQHGIYTSQLPWEVKLNGLPSGKKIELDIEGRAVSFEMVSLSPPQTDGNRQVTMIVNDQRMTLSVADKSAVKSSRGVGEKSIISTPTPNQVIAVMPGRIVEQVTGKVAKGQIVGYIEAMKMRISIQAESEGTITWHAATGDTVAANQHLATLKNS
ncbi:ATP-grasp domain-containing protein [bacterium]|nr:ATP-grasp domain-containing protein [bacterium]